MSSPSLSVTHVPSGCDVIRACNTDLSVSSSCLYTGDVQGAPCRQSARILLSSASSYNDCVRHLRGSRPRLPQASDVPRSPRQTRTADTNSRHRTWFYRAISRPPGPTSIDAMTSTATIALAMSNIVRLSTAPPSTNPRLWMASVDAPLTALDDTTP